MDLSEVPGLKYLWAWWRRGEADLAADATLPAVIAQFSPDELIPLKGFHFRVAHRGKHGIVLAPVGFTNANKKRLVTRMRRRQAHVG